MPDPTLNMMNDIVKGAVNLCSGCYICVGIFGYIAFSAVEVGGNNELSIRGRVRFPGFQKTEMKHATVFPVC